MNITSLLAILCCIITLNPWAIEASLDTKRTAEYPSLSAAGIPLVCASTATAAQPAPMLGQAQKKREEARLTPESTVLKEAINNNDIRFITAHAKFLRDEHRKEMVRHAAQHQRPEALLALLPQPASYAATKKRPLFLSCPNFQHRQKEAFNRYLYTTPDLTLTEYATYQKARAIGIQNAFVAALDGSSNSASAIFSRVPLYIHSTPEEQTEKNNALIKALNENNTGAFLQALDRGANPNFRVENGDPIAFKSFNMDPVFLKMLLDTKKLDPRTIITSAQGNTYPLLDWSIDFKKPEHAKLLLDAGFDPHMPDYLGRNFVENAFQHDDITFFRICIKSKCFNPNTTMQDTDGKRYPLLYWAMNDNKPEHAQLLLDAGADPNPVIEQAYHHDNIDFFRMCIKSTNFNPKTAIEDDAGNFYPLLSFAMHDNKAEHFQLLLSAGADPNVIADRTINSNGNPIIVDVLLKEDESFLRILLDNDANVDITIQLDSGDRMPLIEYAQECSPPEHVRLLQEARAKQAEKEHIYCCA